MRYYTQYGQKVEDVRNLIGQRVELSRYGAAALACNSDFGSTETFVERVHEHKHLGIYLNTLLCWARQIHVTCLRANCQIFKKVNIRFVIQGVCKVNHRVWFSNLLAYFKTF